MGLQVITIPFEQLSEMYQESVKEGYEWGCECGEGHTTRESAEHCKKCRDYLTMPPKAVFHTPKPN